MRLHLLLLGLSALGLLVLCASEAGAGAKEVKTTKEWKGSVGDANLQKGAPEVIVSAKALEKLWKDWMIEDKAPKVDFEKEIVVIVTTVGSKINLGSPKLDDKGNLQVNAIATSDFGQGFRYVIATVPREGVKTVNKKELPKE
jgi:hypothetical protein